MAKSKIKPFMSSIEQEAQGQLTDSIEQLLAENDIYMGGLLAGLESCCCNPINDCDKELNKLKKKIIKLILKLQVDFANYIDYLFTKIINILTCFNNQNQWILQQLCVQSGTIGVGGNICSILACTDPVLPVNPGCPTVNLDFTAALGFFSDLIEVLREIRNRMPPEMVELPGEDPTGEPDSPEAPGLPTRVIGSPDWPLETDIEMEIDL